MRKSITTFLITLGLALLLSGCENFSFLAPKPKKTVSPKPPVGAVVVAKVGNFYVTEEYLNSAVDVFNNMVTQMGTPQNKIDTREKKVSYLRNELVRKYMLYQEALDRGLENRTEVVQALENTKMNLLVGELLREELQKIEVTNQEVEDFYNQNKELLKEPEQRKILEIVTATEDEAKQANIELLKGTDFASVARQYSKAATASKGGDLGYISLEFDPAKRIKFDKFYEVAFSPSLESGDISSIFKGPEGYCIVKVEAIKKSAPKALSELSENIKNWLLTQKQEKAIADLSNKLQGEIKTEVYEGKVE